MSDANSGLASPPMVGDDRSYASSPHIPSVSGDGEDSFVPSKMGYLHIKNQVIFLLLLRVLESRVDQDVLER